MSGVAFLGIFFVLSVIGSLIVWLRHRTPRRVEAGVDEFRRGMDALSRPPSPNQPPRPTRPLDDRDRSR